MALQKPTMNPKSKRWMGVLMMVMVAFFSSYAFAVAKTGGTSSSRLASPGDTVGTPLAAADGSGAAGGGGGCACCGGGAPGGGNTKAAEVTGDLQKIDVDLSQGYYDPTTIELKAGIPAEITFGQGGGCTAAVQSEVLGFYEDLTGGPKTVKLPALEPGEYDFSCGMQMVFGKIVVK